MDAYDLWRVLLPFKGIHDREIKIKYKEKIFQFGKFLEDIHKKKFDVLYDLSLLSNDIEVLH